jgi:hypothetical protein
VRVSADLASGNVEFADQQLCAVAHMLELMPLRTAASAARRDSVSSARMPVISSTETVRTISRFDAGAFRRRNVDGIWPRKSNRGAGGPPPLDHQSGPTRDIIRRNKS